MVKVIVTMMVNVPKALHVAQTTVVLTFRPRQLDGEEGLIAVSVWYLNVDPVEKHIQLLANI